MAHEYRPERYTGTPFNTAAARRSRTIGWVGWGPYHVVDVFSDVVDEVTAIRTTSSIDDKTPLVKTFFEGPDAERFVDAMQVRDATKIDTYHTNYTFWCDESGNTINEGLVFRLASDRFVHCGAPLMDWLIPHADSYDIEICEAIDAGKEFGILTLQGPKTLELIKDATDEDISDLRFSRGRDIKLAGGDCIVWRTGFTGELGFEFWVPADAGNAAFDLMCDKGAPYGAIPIGNGAQDIGRIEVGMLISGTDYRPAGPSSQSQAVYLGKEEHYHTPTELNFGSRVQLDKTVDFVGKDALLRESETGPRKVMKGLIIDWTDIEALWRDTGSPSFISQRVYRNQLPDLYAPDGTRIGFATSITWSPNLNQMIGFAHIGARQAAAIDCVTLDWKVRGNSGRINAGLVDLPFREIRW